MDLGAPPCRLCSNRRTGRQHPLHPLTFELAPFIVTEHGNLVRNPLYDRIFLSPPPTEQATARAPTTATAATPALPPPVMDPADETQSPAPTSPPSAGAATTTAQATAYQATTSQPAAPRLAPLQPLPPLSDVQKPVRWIQPNPDAAGFRLTLPGT